MKRRPTTIVHLVDAPRGFVAVKTACGVNVRGAVSQRRERVTCENCLRQPMSWRGLEGYSYRRPNPRSGT